VLNNVSLANCGSIGSSSCRFMQGQKQSGSQLVTVGCRLNTCEKCFVELFQLIPGKLPDSWQDFCFQVECSKFLKLTGITPAVVLCKNNNNGAICQATHQNVDFGNICFVLLQVA